ncbi:MAG: permease [Deltaproteobacteria bacterium]|nr:permease [Deltaproteobacteria bacterium]
MAGFWKDQSKGLVIGLSGGFFGGLAGLGGGLIMIPLMSWTMRLTQHQAHGTSLAAIIFTSLIGSITYFRYGSVDWTAALILAASAMLTARFGALYAHSLPERKLRKAFAWFLILISLLLVSKGTILKLSFQAGPVAHYLILIITGIFTGFLAGMMGVGGGGVMVPPLVIFIGMPQHLAQGTSLLAMLPGSAVGAFTHYKLGNVVREITLGLIIGAAAGAYMGASLAHVMPELYLRVIFSIVGVWVGIKYLKDP